jgi:5'-methylthioadenosine phosphorylase
VAMVTDYDCWREGEAHVDVATVVARLQSNAKTARDLVLNLAKALPAIREASPIDTNLDFALITAPDVRDPALLAKLDAVAGRVLK